MNMIDERIDQEIINRAVTKSGNAIITLSSGEKTVFHYGMYITDLPKKLQMTDPIFYEKLCDEIFDDLHPY